MANLAHEIIRGNLPPEAGDALKSLLPCSDFSQKGIEETIFNTIIKIKEFIARGSDKNSGKDDFGLNPSFVEILKPFFQFLYYVYFRVEAKGAENIPVRGPAMLVANHSGGLPYDATMIYLAVFNGNKDKRGVRFLVENFVFDLPLLGSFISRTGGVRANHENATKLLKDNNLIVVFPEGVKGAGKNYDERYKLTRFGHGGFVRLAMRTGVPIIPVAVVGAEEIHPIIWKSYKLARPLKIPFIPFTPTFPWLGPFGLVPLPSKWRIVFGKPVSFDRFKPSDADNERLVQKQATMIRDRVQKMIDTELKRRKSIWI